jgi:hypothetical protein
MTNTQQNSSLPRADSKALGKKVFCRDKASKLMANTYLPRALRFAMSF